MNQNIEYEKFTQEIYQELMNAHGITTNVKHNIKLTGKFGQKHQIDVYWEYEIAGVRHKIAIECKNYKSEIPIGKVRDFYGHLSDLTDVSGIMITKVGYQSGAQKYADYYGINLKELRVPHENDDCKIAELKVSFDVSSTHRLFLLDDDWAKVNNINWLLYGKSIASFSRRRNEWGENYLPLETTGNEILDAQGRKITTFVELENELPQKAEHVFNHEDAYVDTHNWGRVKIKAVKYISSNTHERESFVLDARNVTRAILKDVLSGKILLFLSK